MGQFLRHACNWTVVIGQLMLLRALLCGTIDLILLQLRENKSQLFCLVFIQKKFLTNSCLIVFD